MPYILNEQDITGRPFTVGNTQYPPKWIERNPPEVWQALGVTWVDPEPLPEPTADDIIADYTQRIDEIIIAKCHERRYDSPEAFTKYILTVPDPTSENYDIEMRYKTESIIGNNWVSKMYAKAESIMMAVLQGQRPLPTFEQLVSELPDLNWNDV